MPTPTVIGHGGELVVGNLNGVPVALLSGRAHLYEGHAPERSVFGVRLLASLGIEQFLLTNAAGGIAEELTVGSLMLITDHLNLTGHNPLLGRNDDSFGPRFPDMSEAYDAGLRQLLLRTAADLGQPLHSGVYAGLLGPNYETPAEIRMLRALGASAVGMSTVLETIALRHLGAKVAGISCVTNRAAGLSTTQLSHAEVAEVAKQVEAGFGRLVSAFASNLP
jgi:purine-nucleoside phosphorylase